jgi:purine-binding chemotaxis protein CheW
MTAIEQILIERARVLAQPLHEHATDGERQLVVIRLGDECYGVDSRWVQEVVPTTRVTPLPGAPAYWAGLVNLRGRLVPLLDLNCFLISLGVHSAQPPTPNATSRIVLVNAGGLEVGLLADDVSEVRRVAASQIGPSLAESAGTSQPVIVGVTPDLLSVLDLEALLRDPQLAVKDELG